MNPIDKKLTVADIAPKLEAFKRWLSDRGAEVLVPMGNDEVLRFRTERCTSVIYKNTKGELTFFQEAEEAWVAFRKNTSWRGSQKQPRYKPTEKNYQTIRDRDGDNCFFCAHSVDEKDQSVEHLVAKTAGGPNHISNMFLAHRDCNTIYGSLSAPEKIAIHLAANIRVMCETILDNLKGGKR